jgi:crossover junction endodeoxyribonuclease RusA
MNHRPLRLIILERPLSSNDRTHWRQRAKDIALLRTWASLAARNVWGTPAKARRTIGPGPVVAVVFDESKTRNTRDTANVQPHIKAAVDGLTDYGLWPDDTADHLPVVIFTACRPSPTKTDTVTLDLHSAHTGPITLDAGPVTLTITITANPALEVTP